MSGQPHDKPESRTPGGQGDDTSRPRLTARRRLTPAGTQNTTSGSTNPQPPTLSSTRPYTGSPITNFVRNGDNWSYTYEHGGTRILRSGTGDIPAPLTRTTPNGLEEINFSRDGIASSSISAPPGASMDFSDAMRVYANTTGNQTVIFGGTLGATTISQGGITSIGGVGGIIRIGPQGKITTIGGYGAIGAVHGQVIIGCQIPAEFRTSTNPQGLTTSAAQSIKNFLRTGDHWSYNYESGETKLFANGTGDIPDPITRTTERGVERIILNRDGVPASSILAPPGTSFSLSGFTGISEINENEATFIGVHQGNITLGIEDIFRQGFIA